MKTEKRRQNRKFLLVIAMLLLLAGCQEGGLSPENQVGGAGEIKTGEIKTGEIKTGESKTGVIKSEEPNPITARVMPRDTKPKEFDVTKAKEIYLAGGCFWGMEEYFARIPGVLDVESGYANGFTEDPSYQEVCTGMTGFAETIHLWYDPEEIHLRTLLRQYFKIIDPTLVDRQGNDVGNQYRTGIYYADKEDLDTIQVIYDEVQANYELPIATELLPILGFYKAEEYHQDYLQKNPTGYCHIHFTSLADLEEEEARAREEEKTAAKE